jgi:hypothetical protein
LTGADVGRVRAVGRALALQRLAALALPAGALLLLLVAATAGPASAQDPSESPSPSASDTPTVAGPPAPTPIVHPSDGSSNTCYDCHLAVNAEQKAIAETWSQSIHGKGGIGCADCHGGDPTSDQITVAMSAEAGFIGTPGRERTVGVCGSCHSDPERMRQYNLPTDQYAKYWTSVHGQRLETARDDRVAICIDCHGSHDVKKASDSTAPVYPTNVPKLCASCHANAELMKPYGIPTDQFEVYQQSVHGVALLTNLDVRAPSCASCHGSHGAKPPRDTEVVEVCGKCHTATQALYEESRHAELGKAAPKCWTCHGTHDVSQPGQRMFFHETEAPYECTTCHSTADPTVVRIEIEQFENEADRRCDTCHHPQSTIYSQVEGIAGALLGAQTAYDSADTRIGDAARLGMIVSDADVALSEAKTSLIQAQAAVHTTKLTSVATLATEAQTKAGAAGDMAQAKIDESIFRREAMVVVVALIVVNVLALYSIKRRLDRQLEG